MRWTSWFDYMTRIALKSNRECEARLPVLLLRTATIADVLEASAAANLVSAAIAARVLEAEPPHVQWTGDAPWYAGHAELERVVNSVRNGATGTYDADVKSYAHLCEPAVLRRTKASKTVLKRIIKLFHQVELAVYFRLHDLANPRSGACAQLSAFSLSQPRK